MSRIENNNLSRGQQIQVGHLQDLSFSARPYFWTPNQQQPRPQTGLQPPDAPPSALQRPGFVMRVTLQWLTD